MSTDDWGTAAPQAPAFDTQGVDPSKVGSLVMVDQPGKYHFQITAATEKWETHVVKDSGNGTVDVRPHILLTCTVCETVPGQSPAGSAYFHRLLLGGKGGAAIEDWAKNATMNFLVGIGIIKEHKANGTTYFIDPETNQTAINIPTLANRLRGLQFIGNIKLNKSDDERYDDRYELPFGQGVFQVNDPRVANVPKNVSIIPGATQAPPAAAPAAAPAQPVQAAQPMQAAPAPQPQPVQSPPFDPTPQVAQPVQAQPVQPQQPVVSGWDMSKI